MDIYERYYRTKGTKRRNAGLLMASKFLAVGAVVIFAFAWSLDVLPRYSQNTGLGSELAKLEKSKNGLREQVEELKRDKEAIKRGDSLFLDNIARNKMENAAFPGEVILKIPEELQRKIEALDDGR